jgi:hypothetical protein
MVRTLILCCFLVLPLCAIGQTDSVAVDSTDSLSAESEEETRIYDGASDTTRVGPRQFSAEAISRLKADEDLQYKEPPTVAESLWSRFLSYLSDMISELFNSAVKTNWGQLISYLLGLGLLIVIIMLILKVDAFKLLYKKEGAVTMRYNVLDENIHEINFENEIQLAISKNDYRKGVRLLFLHALKILSDKNYIAWEQGKTNHEYVAEVKEETLRKWLHQLSFYFDYAWYGNFSISREMFEKVNTIFVGWKAKIK